MRVEAFIDGVVPVIFETDFIQRIPGEDVIIFKFGQKYYKWESDTIEIYDYWETMIKNGYNANIVPSIYDMDGDENEE